MTLTCGGESPSVVDAPEVASTAYFANIAEESGVRFQHFHGAAGDFYLAEVTAGGAALLDFDNDGDLDIYLTQGAMLPPGRSSTDAEFPLPEGEIPRDRLFANRLESGVLKFEDVTEAAGISAFGYGMGVASGDFNNDGRLDLYVTNLESNQLFLGSSNGIFSDATAEWDADDARWSVPATVVDLDRDGWLDLFVGNYVDLDINNPKQCFRVTGARDYCGPLAYTEVGDRLFLNQQGRSFRAATRDFGLHRAFGSALGSVFLDANGDRWPDLYVANDGRPNQLWINQQGQGFVDEALERGSALNAEGQAEASMGVVATDVDNDGDEDLFMAHLAGETHTVYRNDGNGYFADTTIAMGMAAASKWATGFGALSFDYDNDGDLDILTVNGAVQIIEEQATRGVPYPLRMRNQLFANEGNSFVEVSDHAGPAFEVEEVSRGAAAGDVDNDGDIDVLILNNNGPAELLLNQVGQERNWLGIRLLAEVNGGSQRDAIGARAVLTTGDGRKLHRTVATTGSFASSSDPRLLFGLSDSQAVDLVVTWVSGKRERFSELVSGTYQTLVEGTGQQMDDTQ